jgi:ferritin
MINKNLLDALNAQIGLEAHSSFVYLAMASWCDKEGLKGCADFFYNQSDEERVHMLKILHYVNEMDCHAVTPAVPQPAIEYKSIQEVFKLVYAQEQKITAAIYDLLSLAIETKEHSTHNFLQWYITEQREEEALVRSILDKIKLIGEGGQSLYYIDKEIEKINKARMAAETAADAADAPAA